MKNIICILCSLAIVITCIAGCNNSNNNPFLSENAIKGQLGDLYYIVPENAVLNDSTDELVWYKIPIDNSTEEYQLIISCTCTDNENEYESIIQNIDEMKSQAKSEAGAEFTNETIDTFLGEPIDNGCKREGLFNGQKAVVIVAAKEGNMYTLGYLAKTGFYEQSIWDNFYAQAKLV